MVPWYWIPITAIISAIFGALIMAIIASDERSDPDD